MKELSDWLLAQAPELKGFSASNLWRMKQFYEMYADTPKLATLLRELSWTKHQSLTQCKSPEEREFYLIAATRGHWSHRELARQIQSSAFERTMLSDLKLATPSRVVPPDATGFYLPSYSPELNPDELLNADLKHSVTTAAPARTAKALTRTAIGSLRSIQKQPTRVQNYFQHKDVRYAAS